MNRKKFLSIIFIAVVLSGVCVFRNQITLVSARFFLNKTFGDRFTCDTISSNEGSIDISDFSLIDETFDLKAKQINFTINFKQLLLNPRNFLKFFQKKSSHWSSYLAAMKQNGFDFYINQGDLTIDGHHYYFTFEKGEKEHEIGKLQMGFDPQFERSPFLISHFHILENQIISKTKVEEIKCEDFFHFGAFAFPNLLSGWTDAEGNIEMHALVIYEEEGQLNEVSTCFHAKNLAISVPEYETRLGFKNLKGELNYPTKIDGSDLPFWKRISCNLNLSQGWIEKGEALFLRDLSGGINLSAEKDPVLDMMGVMSSAGKTLAMKLKGNRAFHEDHAHCLEFDLRLDDDKGTQFDSFLSVKSSESNVHSIQIEANNLLPAQVGMFKGYFSRFMPKFDHWSIVDGKFGGKLIALIESGKISRFEIQDVVCKEVSLIRDEVPFYFSKISFGGRLFEQLEVNLMMPTPHFMGLFFDPIRFSYESYCPKDYVCLNTSLAFSDKGIEVSASADFPLMNQGLDFGFTTSKIFPSGLEEIEKGWIRSEKITHDLYGPIIRRVSEDLKVFGDVDLVGSYDGQSLDLLLQVEQMLTKHPFIDIKVEKIGKKEKTEGRAHLVFEPHNGRFFLDFPLVNAEVYDRTYGMTAQKFDARVFASNEGVNAEIQQAHLKFDGQSIADELSGSLSFKEGVKLSNVRALLPLETDKNLYMKIEEWTSKSCIASLVDEEIPLASCNLVCEENWKGKLSIPSLSQNFELTYSWLPKNNHIKCLIQGNDFYFSARKEGKQLLIDALEVFGSHCQGAIELGSSEHLLQSLTISKEEFQFDVKGKLEWELLTKSSPFFLRSFLELSGAYLKEVPIPFSSRKPFQVGLSFPMGAVISELSLVSGNSLLDLNHIEYLFQKNKTAIHHAAFSISPELISILTDSKILPEITDDFSIHKQIKGVFNSNHEANSHALSAKINREFDPIYAQLGLKNDQATLVIGQEESLIASFVREKGKKCSFRSLKGKWEDLEADLLLDSKGDFKGSIDFNLEKGLPCFKGNLSNHFQKWGVGGNVKLIGSISPSEHFSNWTFKGKVKGRGVEIGGYQIDKVDAKIDIQPGQVSIENVDITDESGKAWISEGDLTFCDNLWSFSFPSVELRSFQPSFVRKVTGSEKTINPFVVKSATFKNVKGALDDLRTISASGNLKFTNLSKKGESVVPRNLPVQALRGIGLEESLFVPASGKLDYLIQEGRIYLRNMEDLISTQGRSQFNPPRNGVIGYIDFDGKVYLDMQVHQSVTRSLPGPINLMIRGNIADPEIIIR